MSEEKRPLLPAAVMGGVIGAALTLGGLYVAGSQGYADKWVREALHRDPQILVDAADNLRDKQYAPIIAQQKAALTTPFASSWKGSDKPDVILVEFFDYACGYCRASLPHIDRLIAEDKGLRVVFRELPILGPDSVVAARTSLAASKAGKFNSFHDALYAAGRPSTQTIAAASTATGVAPVSAPQPEFEAELRRNFQLASSLGATGTPLFVVGDRVFNGAVGYEVLEQAIADARKTDEG